MTLPPMATRWGVTMLLFLGVGGMLYVGGGAVYAKKVQGKEVTPATALAAHPHHSLWLSLGGLVADGVVFSRALVSAWRAGEAYTTIPPVGGRKAAAAAGADDGKTDVAKVQAEKVMEQGGGGGGGGSSSPAAVAVAAVATAAASSDSDSDEVIE